MVSVTSIVPVRPAGDRCLLESAQRTCGVALVAVEQALEVTQHRSLLRRHFVVERANRPHVGGLVKRFAPGELLMQERGRHSSIPLGIDGRAAQLAQVRGTRQRVAQPPVRLVDAHRPLRRNALRRGALGGMAIGMRL
jgi:hypothetical protein